MLQTIDNRQHGGSDIFRMLKISTDRDIGLSDIKPGIDLEYKTDREHLILCRFCGNKITSPENFIEMNGKYNHTFQNPAGVFFTIGCFSSADGCLNHGEPTIEYTWFSGYSWCYAVCSDCNSHLGWYYSSSTSSFYGLILNHLTQNP